MVVTLSQQYNTRGDTRTVMLYTYINRHAGTQDKNKIETFLVHNKIGCLYQDTCNSTIDPCFIQ